MAWSVNRILISIIGWIGAINLLIGYYLIQTKKVEHDNLYYMLLNITGAFCLAANTLYHRAYPSVLTNAAWFLIGIIVLLSTIFGGGDTPPAEIPF